MSRRVLKIVGFFAPLVFTVGCGEKSTVPTNLNQPIPKAVGSDGSAPKAPGGKGGKTDGNGDGKKSSGSAD